MSNAVKAVLVVVGLGLDRVYIALGVDTLGAVVAEPVRGPNSGALGLVARGSRAAVISRQDNRVFATRAKMDMPVAEVARDVVVIARAAHFAPDSVSGHLLSPPELFPLAPDHQKRSPFVLYLWYFPCHARACRHAGPQLFRRFPKLCFIVAHYLARSPIALLRLPSANSATAHLASNVVAPSSVVGSMSVYTAMSNSILSVFSASAGDGSLFMLSPLSVG